MQAISVSSLVRYLKNRLDSDDKVQNVLVSGEISNYHRHSSGHLYFSIKDETATLNCVMFKSYTQSLDFEPKTGDKVILKGSVSMFEASGQIQLYVNKITLDGLGDLYAKYEQLKNKLDKKGIFDLNHKIELEKTYIDNVAVLVGDKSAAMSDIKTTFNRRWPLCNVDYYPVLVQGESAPQEIVNALIEVDKKDYDAIILARGGGSFEDLFCFNDENLVMCIYNLNTFIITGIGHEQDFTLADFVADKRAATPTASVELITPNINDIKDEIDNYSKLIKEYMNHIIDSKKLTCDYYFERLNKFQSHIKEIKSNIDYILLKIENSINNRISNYSLTLKRYSTLLSAYSSEQILKKGYTFVIQNNKIIKRKKELAKTEFEIQFIDGKLKAKGV